MVVQSNTNLGTRLKEFEDLIIVPTQLTLKYRGYLGGPNLLTEVFI